MSEISQHREQRIKQLERLFDAIYEGKEAREMVLVSKEAIESVLPGDIIYLVHGLMLRELSMQPLKTAVNKFINLLSKTIKRFTVPSADPNSFAGISRANYALLDAELKSMREHIRQMNDTGLTPELRGIIHSTLSKVALFQSYYVIKENCLFPLIERHWPDFRCVQLMWSYHDDIRRNLKELDGLLLQDAVDIAHINRLLGDVYFNIYAIKLRDENILFPHLAETIGMKALDDLLPECVAIGFPFVQPQINLSAVEDEPLFSDGFVQLPTGYMSIEQIMLVFNHLPVDITFVDEFDKVRFFSTPEHRIFPRSKAIIGRDVHHCHPKESVHVVEEIVQSFRKGQRCKASFWIQMKGKFILIQYFAVRDADDIYRGVLEVSQEVSGIRQLEGEQRLLDWDKPLD